MPFAFTQPVVLLPLIWYIQPSDVDTQPVKLPEFDLDDFDLFDEPEPLEPEPPLDELEPLCDEDEVFFTSGSAIDVSIPLVCENSL